MKNKHPKILSEVSFLILVRKYVLNLGYINSSLSVILFAQPTIFGTVLPSPVIAQKSDTEVLRWNKKKLPSGLRVEHTFTHSFIDTKTDL